MYHTDLHIDLSSFNVRVQILSAKNLYAALAATGEFSKSVFEGKNTFSSFPLILCECIMFSISSEQYSFKKS